MSDSTGLFFQSIPSASKIGMEFITHVLWLANLVPPKIKHPSVSGKRKYLLNYGGMVVIKIQSNGVSISIFIFIALLFQTEHDHLCRVTKVAVLRTDVGYLVTVQFLAHFCILLICELFEILFH